jgi:drug/metabolite transporter (DMT)-like permease
MPPLIPFVLAVIISASGNLLLKFAVSKIGSVTLSKQNLTIELFKIFTNPFIIIGLAGYVLGFILWLKVLSVTEVSRAYPALVSSTIIMVLIGSTFFLKETFTIIKFLGAAFIIFGIYLLFKN